MSDRARDAGALAARNPNVSTLRRLLRRRSARAEADRFVIEGPRLVIDAIESGVAIDAVYVPVDVNDDDAAVLLARCAAAGVEVRRLAAGVLEQVASTVNPQPALALARPRVIDLARALGDEPAPYVLVLCDIADPGNAGALLRVAEAAGATCIVVCGAAAVDVYNPKVVRSAAGSLFRLPIVVIDEPEVALTELRSRNIRTVAAVAGAGQPYDSVDLGGALALVFGNEAHGLAEALLDRIDVMVTIPMAGRVESLNVATAGAILAFEVARQRRTRA